MRFGLYDGGVTVRRVSIALLLAAVLLLASPATWACAEMGSETVSAAPECGMTGMTGMAAPEAAPAAGPSSAPECHAPGAAMDCCGLESVADDRPGSLERVERWSSALLAELPVRRFAAPDIGPRDLIPEHTVPSDLPRYRLFSALLL